MKLIYYNTPSLEYSASTIESDKCASPTMRKVIEFGNLPVGWHFGEGVAPTARTISSAQQLLGILALLGFTNTDAFPGIEGEIGVNAYARRHTVEVIAEVDGSFTFSWDDESGEIARGERISMAALKGLLISTSERIWSSSASYTPVSSIILEGDSKASPFGTLLVGGISRLYRLRQRVGRRPMSALSRIL